MLTSLLPLCLSLAPSTAPQGPASVSEVLSIDHLLGRARNHELPPWGSLLQRFGRDLDMLAEPEAPIDADHVMNLLLELHAPSVEAGRLHLQMLGSSLLAVGDAADVAKVKERLRAATPMLARGLQVEFAVWDAADRETPAAVLAAAEFSRVFANLEPLARRITMTRHGEEASLEAMRWTRYVRDLDAEVAQNQSLTRPTTAQFGEGAHAVVRAFGLLGGDEFAVHVQFAAATRRGVVRTLQTGLPGAADLEIPVLESDYGAFSGRIPNGGALVATLRGHAAAGGQRLVTVRVLARAPQASTIQDRLGIFPCGALTSLGLAREVGPEDTKGSPAPGTGHVPADALVAFVQSHLGADAEQVSLHCGGGFLVALADAPVLARIEALVRGLQDRLVRVATLRQAGTFPAGDGAATTRPPALHEITAPTLVGRQLTLVRQLETNVVSDVFASIAQDASMLDPNVEALQSGCWLSARLTPVDDGMHLYLRVLDRYAVPPQARSVMPGGVLMTAEVARSRAGHDGAVANGQAIEHGDGPTVSVDGRAHRSALVTTVRW